MNWANFRNAVLFAFSIVLLMPTGSLASPAHVVLASPRALSSEVKSLPNDGAVIVLFSVRGCTYCEKVRRQSLRSLPSDGAYRGRVRVYEVDMNASRPKYPWFEHERLSGKDLAERYQVKFAPTVIVFDPHGRVKGQPLLGSGLADFYDAYVKELVDLPVSVSVSK